MLLFKVVHKPHCVFLNMKTYIMIIYTWPTFTINFKWKYSLDNKNRSCEMESNIQSDMCVVYHTY